MPERATASTAPAASSASCAATGTGPGVRNLTPTPSSCSRRRRCSREPRTEGRGAALLTEFGQHHVLDHDVCAAAAEFLEADVPAAGAVLQGRRVGIVVALDDCILLIQVHVLDLLPV